LFNLVRALLLHLSLVAGAAAAPRGEPTDVRRAVAGGGVINWTRLELEVSATAMGHGGASHQEATEQRARLRIGPAMLDGAHAVPLRTGLIVASVLDEPELGAVLRNRVKQWEVVQATYFASGRVELDGRLPLDVFLRPWLLAHGAPRPPEPSPTVYTGLVVDARGTGAQPALCPSLLADDGAVLWDGLAWREEAVTARPVVWVADPAHPAAAHAGRRPLVIEALRAIGSDLVLGGADSQAVRRHLTGSAVLHAGRVVVVIDP
jgi:hypothetical protein